MKNFCTYMLNNSHDVDDITIHGLTIGYDIANGVVVIVRLDRQMCIAQVVISVLCVWLYSTGTLIHDQLTQA